MASYASDDRSRSVRISADPSAFRPDRPNSFTGGTEGSNPLSSTRESARTLALYDAFVRGRRLSALRVRILRAPSRRNEPGLWLPLVLQLRLPRLPAAGVTVVWNEA